MIKTTTTTTLPNVTEPFGIINASIVRYKFTLLWPAACIPEYTASLFLVDYVCHVLLGRNELSLGSKYHGSATSASKVVDSMGLCYMDFAYLCILMSMIVNCSVIVISKYIVLC